MAALCLYACAWPVTWVCTRCANKTTARARWRSDFRVETYGGEGACGGCAAAGDLVLLDAEGEPVLSAFRWDPKLGFEMTARRGRVSGK